MGVVTGAMSTLLLKLGNLLKEEYELQTGVKGEIMFLKAELESMQAALKVSEAPIDQPPDMKLWARDVKELSYDIEDTIDAFMVRVGTCAPKKLHGLRDFINRSLNLLTKAHVRHKIGTDIRGIKRRITEVSERHVRYKVDNVVAKPVGPTIDSLRLSALYKKATELVGTEEKSDGLIMRLMEGDEASKQQLKIVSIVGFGGLGKTTLANVVYEKLKLKEQFDCSAFIPVSLNPNMENIFKDMLRQLSKHSNIDGEAQLINELREFLRNRRYFVVIDDIWNNSVWEQIKYALIENECGSRIITTTRILDVAKHVGGVYQLEPLSPVDSRKLFYQRIFGEVECPHNQLAEVSERILKKCGGVPLAIITIASLLASKKEKVNTRKHWSEVCQSIGSGLDDSLDVNNMRRILSISYYDLPPHLKTCLLYLSLYPEDYEIPAEVLIWKWIGEGFVHNKQGKRLQEVGKGYLDELINKSLIQPLYITRDNMKAEVCRVHDMVLDLITSLSNEEHFLTTLGGQQPVTVPTKIRRLSLQTSNEDDVKQLSTMDLSYVRSLTMFEEVAFSLLPALSSFPVLRALDLRGCYRVENRHFKDICNLFHLRYLNLRGTCISEIPKEIGNLQSLQVLDIGATNIYELPSTFVQLRQLVYLRGWLTRLPDGFGNLKCLQELHYIDMTSPTMLHDLCGLTELRHLRIVTNRWDERYEEPFLQCLSNLVSLEILYMANCRGGLGSLCENLSPGPQLLRSIDICRSAIHTVPRWMSSLSSLSYLAITLVTLGVEDLQVLGGIPSLGDLFLMVEQSTEGRDERLIIGSGYPFRCLTKLQFWCQNSMEVVFAQGAMQKLQTLKLTFYVRYAMDQFGDFDFGLENLSSLKHASVKMWSYGAEPWEVEAAKAAIRRALDMNPNNPTLEFKMDEEAWMNEEDELKDMAE